MGRTIGETVIDFVWRARVNPRHGATAGYNPDNALDFLRTTVPDFPNRLGDKDVLDYGCGHGWQCCALAKLGIARSITGLDIRLFDEMTANAHATGVADRVRFVSDAGGREYDVVYSCSSFEHFRDPERELRRMIDLTRPGGEVIVTFAEPWFSPHGSHMSGFTGVPWSNILFSERTVLKVRGRYRADGATKYEEIDGGLNKMTVGRFERIVRAAPECTLRHFSLFGVRRLPLVTSIPLIRELATSAACCILARHG